MKMIENTDVHELKQTFVDIPHNSSVVHRARHHEVSIPCPADVIHVLYVAPGDKRKYTPIIINADVLFYSDILTLSFVLETFRTDQHHEA